MSTSALTVGGTSYTVAGRKTSALLVNGWGWDLDAGFWLEFEEYAAKQTPKFNGPAQVTLVGPTGATLFTGDLVSVQPSWGQNGRTWGYRCLGLEYRANWIPVTATDGSGTIRFNVNPATNLDYYVPSLAGLSTGAIIASLLSTHATALTAAGISTDSTTTSSLAALTLVPSNETDVSGDRFWQAAQGVLQQWQRNIRLMICPTGAGTGVVRVVDVTAGTAETLTCGTDPIDPPLLSRNWTNCATQVVCRGLGVIEPGYVSTVDGSLYAAWTAPEAASWNYAAFSNPAGAIDSGTVNTVGSTTSVTITSNNASLTWGVNYWSGIQAWIYLVNTSLTGLTFTESRPITANAALTAGGSAVITLGYPLQNSGSSAYTSYHIIGTDVPLSSTSLSLVYRLYNVNDPGLWIATHLVRQFPVQVPFVGVNASSAVLTSFPTCQVLYSGVGGPMPFTVDPVHGQILFQQPTVTLGNSQSVLAAGGAGVVVPTNVYMMLAYSRGALTTQYPASGYSGTAYSIAGLSRTQTVDVPDWAYAGNTSTITPLAQMLQTSTRDTVVEGTIHYKGWWTPALSPAGGFLMSFAGNGYTTGDEALGASLRAYSVRYLNDGDAGLNYATDLTVSTRKDPRTGEGYYSHLSTLGSGGMLSTIAAGFMPFTDSWQAAGKDISEQLGTGGGSDTDFTGQSDQGGADLRQDLDAGPSNAGRDYQSLRARRKRPKLAKQRDKMLDSWMPGAGRAAADATRNDAPTMSSSIPYQLTSEGVDFDNEAAPAGPQTAQDALAEPAPPAAAPKPPKPPAPKPYRPTGPAGPQSAPSQPSLPGGGVASLNSETTGQPIGGIQSADEPIPEFKPTEMPDDVR